LAWRSASPLRLRSELRLPWWLECLRRCHLGAAERAALHRMSALRVGQYRRIVNTQVSDALCAPPDNA
jgi:hypothetical protein